LGKSNKECLLKGVCLGQEIKQLTNVGLSECSMACSEYFGTDQECWGTTYFRDSQTCSVYSDCPEIDDGVNEAVTNRNTCFMYFDSYNVMVTNGHNGNFQKDLPTEIIDLVFPNTECTSFPYYPYGTHGSGLGFNYALGKPFICGGLGYSENGYHSDDCYTMDLATGEFSKYADLYQPRIYSGPYGAFTGLILFSGGYPLGSNESKSSEVFLDAAADSGPFHFHTADLPTPRKQHCSVFDNTVNQDGNWPGWWITGGRIGELENKTYSGDVTSSTLINQLDLEDGSNWEEGPSMMQAREYHGCTLTSIGDETVLVVAGGRDENETPLSSVEFYFFNTQTWVTGPDLPKSLFEPTMVNMDNVGAILMGGTFSIQGPSSSSIYRLACDDTADSCEWFEMEQKLKADRYGHNAMFIPPTAKSCV